MKLYAMRPDGESWGVMFLPHRSGQLIWFSLSYVRCQPVNRSALPKTGIGTAQVMVILRKTWRIGRKSSECF